MRKVADLKRIQEFFQRLAREAPKNTDVFVTGGASAVYQGWRNSTMDIDLLIVPETDQTLRAIPKLKEELQVNVEFANPSHFIPETANWRESSPFIQKEGNLSIFHYDFYAQALSKIERNHHQDAKDVEEMFSRGLVNTEKLLKVFDEMKPNLFRYPAIDPESFEKAVIAVVEKHRKQPK